MIRFDDISKALEKQVDADVKQIKAIYAEQNRLRTAVMRFRDLENEVKTKEARMRRAMALLHRFPDAKEYLKKGKVPGAILVAVESLDDLPLWEAIAAILEQVSPIQICELQHLLDQFEKKVSRQAIESAIATHKELFETHTRSREKFVHLKR